MQRAVRWNGNVWRATATPAQEPSPSHWISILLSHIVVKPEGGDGGGREWRRRRRKKSVLDLIFHTPASYKRLSYTTLAPNNQSGKGSQNDEIPCHLLPDLFSRVTRREKMRRRKMEKDGEEEGGREGKNHKIIMKLLWVGADSSMATFVRRLLRFFLLYLHLSQSEIFKADSVPC